MQLVTLSVMTLFPYLLLCTPSQSRLRRASSPIGRAKGGGCVAQSRPAQSAEPGDPQRCGSTARDPGSSLPAGATRPLSHGLRRASSPIGRAKGRLRRPVSSSTICRTGWPPAVWVYCRSHRLVIACGCNPPSQSRLTPCQLSLWESQGAAAPPSLVQHNLPNRVTPSGVGLLPGTQARHCLRVQPALSVTAAPCQLSHRESLGAAAPPSLVHHTPSNRVTPSGVGLLPESQARHCLRVQPAQRIEISPQKNSRKLQTSGWCLF